VLRLIDARAAEFAQSSIWQSMERQRQQEGLDQVEEVLEIAQ
jgi:hypothetical protein